MYRITEYEGDYQIENQCFWNSRFDSIISVDAVAEAIYDRAPRKKDYYVLVERDSEGEEAIIGYTNTGKKMGLELSIFISQYGE